MNKNNPCQCESECKTKRCPCLKEGRACTAECQCQQCKNPFNLIDTAIQLSDCARAHIKTVVSLTPLRLKKEYEVPCGCGSASLKSLLTNHLCHGCDEMYYYSFCLGDVMDENSMWHCDACGTCREDGEWHCKRCNTCTYGITLPCEYCGKKSPFAPRGL
jgi:hypothetical protein